MTTYLVSRHQGAVDWMDYMGFEYDKHITHISNYETLQIGDTIIGSLPINIVADLNDRGIYYVHLSLYIPASLRGVELSAEELSQLDAKLEAYEVKKIDNS